MQQRLFARPHRSSCKLQSLSICGICGHTRDPTGQWSRRMTAAMVHRGPDDEGLYCDQSAGIALGARRLSIIDLEGGHQPLSNEDRSVWAVLNGEIYNHGALRTKLRDRGHEFTSGTDTEVLVHLYEERGREMVHALDGMFAFAVWDANARRLLLARDRFGEKPLFYKERDGVLSFASELTALLAAERTRPVLDPAAIDDFFVFGHVSSPRSICAGMSQVAAATLLHWAPGQPARLQRYWSPPAPPPLDVSMPELITQSHRLLSESVSSRLVADVPVGVFLSGGVDSTLVAALAAESSGHRIRTFTVGYDVGGVSEASPARATAAALGAEHHELLLRQEDIGRGAPELLRSMDQPVADQALVALHAVAEFARSEVTVAVGGEGADELFGGYPRYRWLRRAEVIGRGMPRPAGRALEALANSMSANPKVRRLGRIASGGSTLELHVDWVTSGRRALRDELYGPRLSSTVDPGRVVDELMGRLQWDAFKDPAQAHMALDQTHWLPDDVLSKADRASMLASLEMRTPFLHHEVAQLTAAAPIDLQLRNGGKAVLRALLKCIDPRLARRPKTAFRVPAGEWLRGPLAGLLDRQLERSPLYRDGWFDAGAVARLGRAHAAGEDHSSVLWPLLTLGLWLEGFDGEA